MRKPEFTKDEIENDKKIEKFKSRLLGKKYRHLYYMMEQLYYFKSPSLNYYDADEFSEAHAEIKNSAWLSLDERIKVHKKLLKKCGIIEIGNGGQLLLFKMLSGNAKRA